MYTNLSDIPVFNYLNGEFLKSCFGLIGVLLAVFFFFSSFQTATMLIVVSEAIPLESSSTHGSDNQSAFILFSTSILVHSLKSRLIGLLSYHAFE